MAEETDLSRTEPASPRRLQEARNAGDVPRSAEFSAWLVLLAALGMLAWQAPRLLDALQALAVAAFTHAAQPLSPVFIDAAHAALWTVLPVLAAIFVAALIAPMLLSGWVYAPQAAQAELGRANPLKPFVRLFSLDSLFDGSLALLKLALAVATAAWVLTGGWPDLQGLAGGDLNAALAATAAWVGKGVLTLAAVLALAAALDAGWRWWRYLSRHAMTWQEVLAEAREAEVSPEVQAQLRARQQQAGQAGRAEAREAAYPLRFAGEGTNARPRTIDEVIG